MLEKGACGPEGLVRGGRMNAMRNEGISSVRGVVITVLMLVPLIVTELVIGEIARDGWIADVLNQTAQLIALAQPF